MNKIKKSFEQIMTAITFSEAGEHDLSFEYLENSTRNNKSLFKNIRKFFNRQQRAITFAESGESEYALEFIKNQKEERIINKLLVVGNESTFSKDIIDYALEMAQRMSYEILALNTAPLSCETFKLFSFSRNEICKDFEELSNNNVESFRIQAQDKNINFNHIIMFENSENALETINKERKDIAFVVSESIEDRDEVVVRNEEKLHKNVYVYSMI